MNALTAKTSELIKKKKTESEENCVGKKISKKETLTPIKIQTFC